MEFPIYKRDLHKLSEKSEQMFREQVQKQVQYYVILIVNNILEAAESRKTSYTYDLKDALYRTVYLRKPNGEMNYDVKKNIVPDIVEDLRSKFPDCVVEEGPFNNFIYISWE
jgi:hypothetical protein